MATATKNPAPIMDNLSELVQQHQADLWRYLRFLGCDRPEADDLVQETFLSVFRKPLQQRSPGETAAYLRIVARRQMLMLRRRQGREVETTTIQLAEEVWSKATQGCGMNDYLGALSDCLEDAVSPKVRTALNMHYSDGASRSQIAEKMKLTANGVKTMFRRGRDALRECIGRKLKT